MAGAAMKPVIEELIQCWNLNDKDGGFPVRGFPVRGNLAIDYELLLMGMTGQGKSATGNTIVGREQFVAKGGWGAVTKDYHVGHARSNGLVIKIVDIPGFADTDEETTEDKQQLVINAISQSLCEFPNGFHAVLLVMSYTSRMTKEVQDTLGLVFRQFDEEAFKKFGVLVVTNGDAFERENGSKNISLRAWLETNCPSLLGMCGGRCALFDNVTEDKEKKRRQVKQLLCEVDEIKHDTDRYMPKICRFREGDVEEYENDRERVATKEEISGLLGLLKDDLFKRRSKRISIDKLEKEIVRVRGKIEAMDTSVDKKYLQSLMTKLEDDFKSFKSEVQNAKQDFRVINDMQKTLDDYSRHGSWWKTIVKGVSTFWNSLTGGKSKEVFAA